jgi:small subunit ribosomal protein S10
VHKRAIKAWDADPVVVGTWINYLEQYQLAGVGLRVVRWEHAPVGFIKDVLKDMREDIKTFRQLTGRAQIAALGQEIIRKESEVTVDLKNDIEVHHPGKPESDVVDDVKSADSDSTQEFTSQ